LGDVAKIKPQLEKIGLPIEIINNNDTDTNEGK